VLSHGKPHDAAVNFWWYEVCRQFLFCFICFSSSWKNHTYMLTSKVIPWTFATKTPLTSLRGHSRSYILAQINTSYMILYGQSIVTFALYPITAFVLWTGTFAYLTPILPKIWACSPWPGLIVLGATKCNHTHLSMCITVYKLTPTICTQYLNVTLSQCHGNTML